MRRQLALLGDNPWRNRRWIPQRAVIPTSARRATHILSMGRDPEEPEEALPQESSMTDQYPEAYWEQGRGSNYYGYGDDPGWAHIAAVLTQHSTLGALLDVGCAKGYFVKQAWLHGFDAYGVDISAYAVQNAAPEIRDRVFVGNAYDLDQIDDEVYDVVCSWEMLEHVPEGEIDAVIGEMWRVLEPGGLFVHRIALDDSEHAHGADVDTTHVSIFPRQWWEDTFGEYLLDRDTALERDLDARFPTRDWKGRFFAYRKPRDV